MKSLVTTVLFLAGAATVSGGAAVLLTLQSEPGDFVGAGQSISFAYDTLFGSRVTAAITAMRNSKPAMVYFEIDRARNGVGNSLGVLVACDAQVVFAKWQSMVIRILPRRDSHCEGPGRGPRIA
jgi:hypothetical protein